MNTSVFFRSLIAKKWPLLLAFTAILSFGLHSVEQAPPKIENYQGSFECSPEVIYDPKTIAEVQAIVRLAVADGRKIMTGNRKFASQIDAACAPDNELQITLKNMTKVVSFDADKQLITVEAGLRFNDFNDFVREKGLSVNMVTELGTFTIGGMLGSGTHGSTLARPSNMLADYVTEMKIVDGLGNLQVLTGEALNAARVNLGVLGVVVEATIQLEPLFKVAAKAKGYPDDSALEDEILSIARDNYSANIAWFPGLGKYTVTTYTPVPVGTAGDAYNAQAEVSSFQEAFFELLFNGLHETDNTILQCLAADIRYGTRSRSYFRDSDSKRKIHINPVGYSDKMQYFGCKSPDQCVWDRIPIALQEVAIPLEELPNWIADVRRILKAHPKTCFPLNGIYFRFGKASPSYLGMTAGRDTAFLGIEYTLRQEGEAVPKNYFVNLEIEQMSIRKYQARPHWGKNSVAIFEDAAQKYPRWDDFMAFKEKMDPQGIFVNPFWQRLTEEKSMDDYLTPGCNLTGECYCQTDAHCVDGMQCVKGLSFTDARICQ